MANIPAELPKFKRSGCNEAQIEDAVIVEEPKLRLIRTLALGIWTFAKNLALFAFMIVSATIMTAWVLCTMMLLPAMVFTRGPEVVICAVISGSGWMLWLFVNAFYPESAIGRWMRAMVDLDSGAIMKPRKK